LLAPQKKAPGIFGPMRQITQTQIEQKTLKSPGFRDRLLGKDSSAVPAAMRAGTGGGAGAGSDAGASGFINGGTNGSARGDTVGFVSGSGGALVPGGRRKYKERFAPAGQTTQMIIGASPETDRQIIHMSEALYRKFSLKRVYFSAYIPVADLPELPPLLTPPPLKREHRLYQADWLLRFYGFTADEIFTDSEPNLDVDLDPKVVWALRHLDCFPIEVNRASEEELLRIPGVGNTSVFRILRQRRIASVGYDDLKKMGVVLKRARYFLTCNGRYFGDVPFEPLAIRTALGGGVKPQISLFETMGTGLALTGGLALAGGPER
jgi:hypothetical protein